MNTTRGHRKRRVGVVVSDKMDKTVVVEVTRTLIDQTYKKVVRKKKRYKAHDEENQCKVGDKVTIMETRPLSKDKRWRVVTSLS
ncbi:MAG: 30S ribosomal protein S17 [bacterium]